MSGNREDLTFRDDESDEASHIGDPLVGGISQYQWNYWHQHPCSLVLRKYLRDYAEAMKLALMQRWEQGALDLSTEHEIRSRIVQLAEIEKLRFEDVRQFYAPPASEQKEKS